MVLADHVHGGAARHSPPSGRQIHDHASHGLGHTRMATESAVTTDGSHPFWTGGDLCLVHNGSLSNHNWLRTRLRREGIQFQTANDSEVAAGYLTWRLAEGDSLDRLAAAEEVGQLDRDTAGSLREAFGIVFRVRHEHHAECVRAGRQADNRVDPRELSLPRRAELTEALSEVAAAQRKLALFRPMGL